MHKCPLFTRSCLANGSHACEQGYTGPLCGACADSYGITAPLQCRKCMPTGRQLGLYVLLVSATVVFMAVTVQLTWQDNQQASASLRPSDLIKVLIQYLQYVVILGSMSVPWPPFLRGMFAAAGAVFGASSGEALSLDCLLQQHGASKHKLPLAVQRQLLLYVAAVASYACVVLLLLAAHWMTRVVRSTCRRTSSTRSRATTTSSRVSWGKALVAVLVLVIFAYPTLVKGGLSFFACVQIDDASKGPHTEYAALNHPAGYWVSDIQQECFAGWHKQWALGFGIPVVVLFCVGVLLGVWLLLWRNSSRLGDPDFRQYCGFLYRNYTESKAWWEAVWAVQTALLTAVSVFHFTCKPTMQSLVWACCC